MLTGLLFSCTTASDEQNENCQLDAPYTFNFEQAQYYALPNIEFSFSLDYDWQVRMPEFAKQNHYYYQMARLNDAGTNSILLTVKPFKREGAYISISEQSRAMIYHTLQAAKRDSWVSESQDTVDGWWVDYGRYQQEPWDYVIAHKLIARDTTTNSLLLELQMQCPPNSFATKNERCLDQVIRSFKIYL